MNDRNSLVRIIMCYRYTAEYIAVVVTVLLIIEIARGLA